MKKVIYIGIAVVALGFASCSKEEIRPNTPTDTATPIWKANTGGGENIFDPNGGGGSNEGEGGGGITDPEKSEEESLSNDGQ